MALATDRQTKSRNDRPSIQWPVAASVTIYAGALVMVDSSGYAAPADPESGTAGSIGIIGVAARKTINTGSAGAINVELLQGEFFFSQSGFAQSDCAKIVYALDDETLEDDSASAGTEPQIAGVLTRIESGGAWVDINLANTVSLASAGGSVAATYIDIEYTAGEDMTEAQYALVVMASNDTVELSQDQTTPIVGILQNAPDVGQTATVRVAGLSTVILSISATAGDRIIPAGGGGSADAWDTESEAYCIGICKTGGNDTCTVLITHEGDIP